MKKVIKIEFTKKQLVFISITLLILLSVYFILKPKSEIYNYVYKSCTEANIVLGSDFDCKCLASCADKYGFEGILADQCIFSCVGDKNLLSILSGFYK